MRLKQPLCWLTLVAAGCARPAPQPPATLLDAEAERRAALEPEYQDAASDRFLRHFHQDAALVAALRAGGGLSRRPSTCAVSPSGDVYLADGESPSVYRWAAGTDRLAAVPLSGPPVERVTSLDWSDARGTLEVLEGKKHQVRSYDAAGRLGQLVVVNGGQTSYSVHRLGDGRLLMGGARWETPERVTLAALHAAGGALQGAFVHQDTGVTRNTVQMAPPVLIAPLDGGEFLAAAPTSYRIGRYDLSGRLLGTLGEPYAGYRAPPPLRDSVPDFTRLDAWTRAWHPLVFLHQGDGLTFAGFQMWRGRRKSFRLEVYGADGRRVATEMDTDSRPLCGRGNQIVFASSGQRASVRLARYNFNAPGAAGRAD